MIKLIYSLFFSLIFNSILVNSASTYDLCTYNCESINHVTRNYPNDNALKHLNENNWWVVKYADGRYYYHNFETREDTWDYPFQEIGYETIILND